MSDDIDRALEAAEAGFEIMLAYLAEKEEKFLGDWEFDNKKWKFEFYMKAAAQDPWPGVSYDGTSLVKFIGNS